MSQFGVGMVFAWWGFFWCFGRLGVDFLDCWGGGMEFVGVAEWWSVIPEWE